MDETQEDRGICKPFGELINSVDYPHILLPTQELVTTTTDNVHGIQFVSTERKEEAN